MHTQASTVFLEELQESNKQKIASSGDDFQILAGGVCELNVSSEDHYKKRLTFKDYGITRLFCERELSYESAREMQILQEVLPKWLQDKVTPSYTNEYIAIKRKNYIAKMLQCLEVLESVLDDKIQVDMQMVIFTNEIKAIYKNLIETNQEENFLSIINTLEEVFQSNTLTKKVLKESKKVFKNIRTKDSIEYQDYESAVAAFFDLGIEVIGIKEKQDNE